MGRVDDVID